MSSSNPDFWMTDEASIGRVASTPEDRRLALSACMLAWNTQDIGSLLRVDSTSPEWHGWTMTLWKEESEPAGL